MPKPNKRPEIIIACQELLQEEGYQSLNMLAVAEKCEIAVSGLYYHFKNKDDLIKETIISYKNTFQSILTEIEREKDARKCLERLIDVYYLVLEPNNNKVCICVSLMNEFNTLPRPIIEELKSFCDLQVEWIVKVFQKTNPISQSEAAMLVAAFQNFMATARLRENSKYFKVLSYSLLENFLISHEKTGISSARRYYDGTR